MLITNPFSPNTLTRDQVHAISRGWWVLLVSGVISAIAGGIIFFADWTIGDLAWFIGALLLFRGGFMMLSTPLDGAARGWAFGLGAVEAAFGIGVFVWPVPTLLVVAVIIGWYVLFSGIVAIAGAITGRGVLPYWGLTLAFGIFETVISFWLLAQPGLTLLAAVLAIGLWSMVSGVLLIALSFEVKRLPVTLATTAGETEQPTSLHSLGTSAVG